MGAAGEEREDPEGSEIGRRRKRDTAGIKGETDKEEGRSCEKQKEKKRNRETR